MRRRILRPADVADIQRYRELARPSTEATRTMIGADALSSMKSGAYLINVARGNLVDETALAQALRDGGIAGAATDVSPKNRQARGIPCSRSRKTGPISPHIAGVSSESARRIMIMAAENIGRALAGREPLYVVNP